ncbi:MAG: hypothetical protein V3U78_06265 [Thiotrichaceae bacterium]
MKTQLLSLVIGASGCMTQVAIADTSLADKSLKQVSTSSAAAKAVTLKPPQAKSLMPSAPSKVEKLIKKAKHLQQGTSALGKNVAPIISKDVVGVQYSTKW